MGSITIILFLFGFFAYFSKQKYLTLIVIAVLSSQYFRLTDANFNIFTLSLQHGDLALLLIFTILPFKKRQKEEQLNSIRNAMFIFLGFLTISICYDLIINNTTPMQVFRTTRKTGYLAFFFLIKSFTYRDYKFLLGFIFSITLIHSILFIFQYILGYSLLPGEVSKNELGGYRFNNLPTYIIPIFAYVVFSIKRNNEIFVYFIILLTVIVLGQSRGLIVSAISIIFMYLFLNNKLKLRSTIIASSIFFLGYNLTIIFLPIIGERFSQMFNEIGEVNKMNFYNLNDFYHQGSFIFRFGLTYERIIYIIEEPSRILLGVGYVPDMDITQSIFTLGTHSPTLPTGHEQFNSIDILFPNIITRYGILGSLLFLSLVIKFYLFSIRLKNEYWGKVFLAYLISLAFISLINETFYNGFYFLFLFFFMGLILTNNKSKVSLESTNN